MNILVNSIGQVEVLSQQVEWNLQHDIQWHDCAGAYLGGGEGGHSPPLTPILPPLGSDSSHAN